MSEALAAVYPQTTLQTCIVHLIRHSLDFANWKERQLLVSPKNKERVNKLYTRNSGQSPS
jgi:transposase-like protein